VSRCTANVAPARTRSSRSDGFADDDNSRRHFLTRALALTGLATCGSEVRADLPEKPPPTLEWLVRYSPIIAVCDVERIGYVRDVQRGGPALYSEDKPATGLELQVVMELRVVEWLRAPRRYAERPLRAFGFSAYDYADLRNRYLGGRFVFFLQDARSEDRRPGGRNDYYTGVLSTSMHGVTRPEPLDRVPEVLRLLGLFPEARPYGQ
jgi:hypothetical protein